MTCLDAIQLVSRKQTNKTTVIKTNREKPSQFKKHK